MWVLIKKLLLPDLSVWSDGKSPLISRLISILNLKKTICSAKTFIKNQKISS